MAIHHILCLLAVLTLPAAIVFQAPDLAIAASPMSGAVAGAVARGLLGHLSRQIHVRPGWCEIATAAVWTTTTVRWSTGSLPLWWVPTLYVITWFAVALTAADLLYRRLPNALTLTAYLATAIALTFAARESGDSILWGALLGCLLFLGLHAVIHWWRPRSLGAGDVKLAGTLGAVLGAIDLAALPMASMGAAVLSLMLRFTRRPAWRTGVPHGPGLLVSTCVIALFPGTGLLA